MPNVAEIEPRGEAGASTQMLNSLVVLLRRFDIDSLRLLQTRFRRVQDYPFNR